MIYIQKWLLAFINFKAHMKIAFFVHCFFPQHFYGTETYTFDLARHYQAAGHDVVVVSAVFQGEPATDSLISRYQYQGIPVFCIDKNHLPHSRVKETYYQPDMRKILERLLTELNPDLIHVTHLINHTSALLEVAGELGIRAYATFTDFFGFCLNNKLEGADGNLCAGPSKSRTNCVACHLRDSSRSPHVEAWMRQANTPFRARFIAEAINLLRHFPGQCTSRLDGLVEDIARRPETLSILYNKTFSSAVAPTNFLRDAYKRNGISLSFHNIWFGVDVDRSFKPDRLKGHAPVIGYIGQIAPHKGIDLLVGAFIRLPKKAAELRIYGPFDQDINYMQKLKDQAHGHNIRFMGTFPSEKMANILSEIDLLVIPSRWYENSPLVLLNALATHTPVLVSDVEGMTEFLDQGKNGSSFTRGCVDSLHYNLVSYINQKERLFAFSKTTHFERSTENMAADTFKIYS
jgi:glycosyltransferase involved in cell wall biosynthesis